MKFNCAYTQLVDIHKIQPNPKNMNRHPEKQIDMLAKIIDYQGQRSPVVVSKRSGFVTKGHGRLMAMQKLQWTQVAVDYQDYESEAQEYADIVADNKIAELANFDDDMMMEEIRSNDALAELDMEFLGLESFKADTVDDLPSIPDVERGELRQYAFQVTEDQKAVMDEAVQLSKNMGDFGDTGNSNSNGNAIARICEIFITQNQGQ